MRRNLFLIMVLWVILPQPGRTQARTSAKAGAAASYKLQGFKVTGTARYTDKEMLAACGLRIGQDAADGDFREAAKRLGDSGMFSDVIYSFSASASGVRLEMQVTDAEKNKLVPARFENFVWFTDPELIDDIRQHVPLFKKLVPVTGRLADEVSETLQVLFNDKRLPGRIDFVREGNPDGGDLTGIVYRVEEVSLRIRNVEFSGASPEQKEFLAAAVRKLPGAEYTRSSLAKIAQYDLVPQYSQRGYLKAEFGPSDAHVVTQPAPDAEGSARDEIEVDAILPVNPGKQYLVSGVNWKGNAAVNTDEASHLFHLVVGQPADALRLVRDVQSLDTLYRNRGYMAAQVKPDAQIDDEKAQVHYDINITEGDLYKMGELEILGVDSPSHDRLRDAWTLQEGQPYNAGYTRKFLDDAARFLPREARFSVSINEELSAKDKAVDVTIHFKMQ